MPHSDPYELNPGGCCSVRGRSSSATWSSCPTRLPQDHTLFTLLRKRSIEPWLEQVGRIESVNGLVQSVTHPDPGYLGDADNLRLFVEFLDALRDRDGLWHALPRDVARWWRTRDSDLGDEMVDGLAVVTDDGPTSIEFRSPTGA